MFESISDFLIKGYGVVGIALITSALLIMFLAKYILKTHREDKKQWQEERKEWRGSLDKNTEAIDKNTNVNVALKTLLETLVNRGH
jgi:Na+(H+)/acetate symporter ActP